MSSLKLATILAFALTNTALAADTAPPAAPAQAATTAAKDDKAKDRSSEKLICTRQAVVGTKIPKRVCKTAAQAEEDRHFSQQTRDQMRQDLPFVPAKD